MSAATPVIIEAAINGTTTPKRNPNVPRTPDEIAAEAIRCIEAGASITHNYNGDRISPPSNSHRWLTALSQGHGE